MAVHPLLPTALALGGPLMGLAGLAGVALLLASGAPF
jgi:hypothetical protein